MTLGDLIAYARKLTKTTTAQFSDADLIIFAKIWIKKIQREVASVRQDVFGNIKYADIVNAQEDYHIPADCLEFKGLEVTYNGKDYFPAKEVDMNGLDLPWSDYESNQPQDYPVYDLINNRLYISPTPSADETKGLKFWYIERPAEVTATTDTPMITLTIDEMLLDYQYLIADGIAIDICKTLGSDRQQEFYSDFLNGVEKMKLQIKQLNIGPIIGGLPSFSQYE